MSIFFRKDMKTPKGRIIDTSKVCDDCGVRKPDLDFVTLPDKVQCSRCHVLERNGFLNTKKE